MAKKEIDMAKERKAQEAADSQSMPKRAGLPTGNDLLPELIKKNKRKK